MPLSHQIIYKGPDPQKINKIHDSNPDVDIVSNIAFTSITDCLHQLSSLAKLSNQIFTDIIDASKSIDNRIKKIIAKKIELEHNLLNINITKKVSILVDTTDINSHRQILQNPQSQLLLDRRHLPLFIKERYNSPQLDHVIDFSTLDTDKRYFKDGHRLKTLAYRYSNPDFFLQQWLKVQEERLLQLDDEKKQQKMDKKRRRKKMLMGQTVAGATTHDSKERKRKSSINWQDR